MAKPVPYALLRLIPSPHSTGIAFSQLNSNVNLNHPLNSYSLIKKQGLLDEKIIDRKTLLLMLIYFFNPSLVYSGTSDGNGHTWTPDGSYENEGIIAEFSTEKGVGSLSAGNACYISGKLKQSKKGSSTYTLITEGGDGMGCPDAKVYTITILNGPALRAAGNAEKIKITHKFQNKSVNFSGVYIYNYEKD